MVIDKSLYSASDISAYISGTWVAFNNTFQYVDRVDDDGMLFLSPLDEWVDFDDVEICVPETGLFEHRDSVYLYTLEPVRQWKKSFRTSNGSMQCIHSGDSHNHNHRAIELSLLTFKHRTYVEAYTNVRLRSKQLSLINRDWFLCVSTDFKRVELFHVSNIRTPIAQAFRSYLKMYTDDVKPELGVEVRYE